MTPVFKCPKCSEPIDPGSAAPTWTGPSTPGTCLLGGKSDACLVP